MSDATADKLRGKKRLSQFGRLALLVTILFSLPAAAYYLSSAIILRRDTPPSVPVSASDAKMFARTYLRGGEFNMRLTLNHDGSYAGAYNDGTNNVGTATGNWAVSDKTLTLSPYREIGTMRGALRQLDFVQTDRGIVLVPPDDRKHFNQFGINHMSCFHTMDQLK
jgi:hypothetical protein